MTPSMAVIVFLTLVVVVVGMLWGPTWANLEQAGGTPKEPYGPPPGARRAVSRRDLDRRDAAMGFPPVGGTPGPRYMPAETSEEIWDSYLQSSGATTGCSYQPKKPRGRNPEDDLEDNLLEGYESEVANMALRDMEGDTEPAVSLTRPDALAMDYSWGSLGAGVPFEGRTGQARTASAMIRGMSRS